MVKFGTPGLLQKKGLQGQSDVKRPQQPPDLKPRLLRTPYEAELAHCLLHTLLPDGL